MELDHGELNPPSTDPKSFQQFVPPLFQATCNQPDPASVKKKTRQAQHAYHREYYAMGCGKKGWNPEHYQRQDEQEYNHNL